uniref:Protein kinase domain-containing protein n=1 Tax=Arcella intermedia TaxID=1963864 RepID=A0A6B2L9B0_9EUKA
MVLQRKISVHTEIPEEELAIGELIGEGNAGAVYRGVWRGKYVAIKQFKKEIPFEDFIKELSIMSLVQHPNLVKCYGGVTNGKKWIVDELMQVNLSQVLLNKHIQIDYGIIAEIAINAAAGIDYLHNHCNLIHRDLKSMNLLINTYKTHLEVKVCDFALSRVISKKEQMTGQVGTVSWTAPEVLVGRKKYNEKADVYSFGIILWELVTRREPYKEMNPVQVILDVTRGKREAIPKECPPELKRLINACWAAKYKQRPSMSSVIQYLRKFHKGLSSVDKAQITLNVTTLIGSSQKSESSDVPLKNPSQSSELNISQTEEQPHKFRSSQITEPISETTSEED